jgi:hypothetical protein
LRWVLASRPTNMLGFGVVFGRFRESLRVVQLSGQQVDPSVGAQTNELVFELN